MGRRVRPPGSVPGASIQKLINIDRRKLVEILFQSSEHFVPILVKGLYQTESYSLHAMQLIRI